MHIVGERRHTGPDGWRAALTLTGWKPWYIHERTDEPHTDILLLITSHLITVWGGFVCFFQFLSLGV